MTLLSRNDKSINAESFSLILLAVVKHLLMDRNPSKPHWLQSLIARDNWPYYSPELWPQLYGKRASAPAPTETCFNTVHISFNMFLAGITSLTYPRNLSGHAQKNKKHSVITPSNPLNLNLTSMITVHRIGFVSMSRLHILIAGVLYWKRWKLELLSDANTQEIMHTN